jgi:hypothetical protein
MTAHPYEIVSARLDEIELQPPRVVQLAQDWLAAQASLPEDRRALCINRNCDAEFAGSSSWFFAGYLPVGRSGRAMGGCICPNCAAGDLQNLLLGWVRQVVPDVTLVERQCRACSLCCRAYEIKEPLWKPANTWCKHCRPGKGGCMIYEDRPTGCKEFKCNWLAGGLDDEWYPLTSKMVVRSYIHSRLHDPIMEFWVDPGYPNKWREEPYYSQIKHFSLVGLSQPKDKGYTTQVVAGPTIFMIFPSGEIARRETISAQEQQRIAVETQQITAGCLAQVRQFCAFNNLKFSDSFMLTYEPGSKRSAGLKEG